MDPSLIEDTDKTIAWHKKVKPRSDGTKMFRKEVDTERIIVLKSDAAHTEELERQMYPKEQDVGRIVIEEISEEQPRSKYPRQPKSTELTTAREHVKDVSKPSELNDVCNVSKLDLRKLEPRKVESGRTRKSIEEEKEWVERQGKACLNYLHGSMEINF